MNTHLWPVRSSRRVRLGQLARLVACGLLLGAAAVQRDGQLFGLTVRGQPAGDGEAAAGATAGGGQAGAGLRIIESTGLALDTVGYAGPVPVRVWLDADNRVEAVEPLPNQETPFIFRTLETSGFWHSWDGLPAEVAATTRVDAVTSATYSSLAASENVRAALATVTAAASASEAVALASTDGAETVRNGLRPPTLKEIAALAVLLAAALLPLWIRSYRYRMVQQLCNVAVLGLWCGLLLSHGRLLGVVGGGLPRDFWEGLSVLLLLAVALLFPLFGHPAHYCTQVCPFGSLQELAGRIPAPRWHLSPTLLRRLSLARQVLWGGLMVGLVAGVGAGWTDWELFVAFAWRVAPPLLLALAGVSLVLAVFVPRPYCRFVCPTGTLLRLLDPET